MLLIVCVILTGTSLGQIHLADKRGPLFYSLINVISGRFLTDKGRTEYMIKNGMPYNDKIKALAGKLASAYPKSTFSPWLENEAKTVIQKYLIMHPQWTFGELYRERRVIFDTSLIRDARRYEPHVISKSRGSVLPVFWCSAGSAPFFGLALRLDC